MKKRTLRRGAFLCAIAVASPAFAVADGPDFWRVHGVASDDKLNVHSTASARSPVIGQIAHDANGLRNKGCAGEPTFREWQQMTTAERERRSRARWCHICFGPLDGWVAGRFLEEGAATLDASRSSSAGAWSIRCQAANCFIEQKGMATRTSTTLRIELVNQGARMTVQRRNLPNSGTFEFYMDGAQISAGPIAVVLSKDRGRLVFEPDDITAGLMKRMQQQKNMVVSFPGEERGVEFHLEELTAALRELERLRATAR